MGRLLELTELGFTSGPLELPEDPYSSVAFDDMEIYTADDVREHVLELTGVSELHPAEPSWYEWRARWSADDRFIEIDSLSSEFDPEIANGGSALWGGPSISMRCFVHEFVSFWEHLRLRFPGNWVHDTGTDVWSPISFRREVEAFRTEHTERAFRPGWGYM